MKSDAEVHEKEPEGFLSRLEAAACYLEIDNKLLLLERAKNKSEPGKWGVPGGKIELNETPTNAALRELFEETGIVLEDSQIRYLGPLYIRKPEADFVYHVFSAVLDQIPTVCLNSENANFKWASLKDLEETPLMAGAMETLHYYWKSLPKKG